MVQTTTSSICYFFATLTLSSFANHRHHCLLLLSKACLSFSLFSSLTVATSRRFYWYRQYVSILKIITNLIMAPMIQPNCCQLKMLKVWQKKSPPLCELRRCKCQKVHTYISASMAEIQHINISFSFGEVSINGIEADDLEVWQDNLSQFQIVCYITLVGKNSHWCQPAHILMIVLLSNWGGED